jgi:long-chain acyl-CoA synthetase
VHPSDDQSNEGLYGRFSRTASRLGERTAVEVLRRDGLESWTYERLRSRAETMAASLAARGVGPGDRCALLAENGTQWCAAFLGLLRLGAVPVPLDTTYTPKQIARLVTDCRARLILVSARFREGLEQSPETSNAACPVLPLSSNAGPEPASHADLPPVASVKPDDTAVILYTSGTTSDPKGVVLTHGNLLCEIDAALHVVSVTEDDAVLGVLPMFHVLAQVANLLLPFAVGARVVFLETLNTADLLRALHERDISAFCCVPQFFYLIHERVLEQVAKAGLPRRAAFRLLLWLSGTVRERLGVNLGPMLFGRVHRALGPRMRLLVTGGSHFDPRIARDLYRLGFDIHQAYGLTETSGAATVLRAGDRRVDSVGHALPGIEVKILPNDRAGEIGGEIAIRGGVVSPGYFGRADASSEVFREGWLHTGDLGHLDGSGRLYVTGRAKDVIVLGSGKNIYPEEIEEHYARSPYIKELCVMGRSLPDAPAAERLHAVVVPDFEVLRERKILNSREILRFEIANLSTELPGHKRILSYDIVPDDLPRTTTRKLKRFEIERRLGPDGDGLPRAAAVAPESATAADETWSTDPHVSRVLKVLRKAAGDVDAIGPGANLELDLGLDSMSRVELLASLEGRFGVSVPDEVAHRLFTVGELVEAVRPDESAPGVDAGTDVDPWQALLDQTSDDDLAVAPVLVARPWVDRLLHVGGKILYAVAWLLLGLRVSGREHLTRDRPFLITPNHQSHLDAFLLASTLPFHAFRDVFYVGASEYFETPFRSWIARLLRIVPVDPDTNLVRAMRAGTHGLRNGKILILFPEGERSIDSEVKTFKKGAAILSLNVGAPIVPVALDGTYELWPRAGRPRLSMLLPFSGARVRIRFGPRLEPSTVERPGDEDYVSLTDRLRRAIGELLEDLRGGSVGGGSENRDR